MFSVPDHSLVLLINPDIASAAELPEAIRTRLETSCDLLRQALRAAAVPARLLGVAEDTGASFASIATCEVIANDPVNVWRDARRRGFIEAITTPTMPKQDVFYLTDQYLAGLPG